MLGVCKFVNSNGSSPPYLIVPNSPPTSSGILKAWGRSQIYAHYPFHADQTKCRLQNYDRK